MPKITELLQKNNLALRFIKFGIIGFSGMLVNTLILWILHDYSGMQIYFASPIAIVFAIFNNFSWNDRFTWKENRNKRHNNYIQRLWKYYFSASIGAFLNYLVLLILTLGFDWYYLISNLAGILTGMVSNFLLGEFWVFKSKVDTD